MRTIVLDNDKRFERSMLSRKGALPAYIMTAAAEICERVRNEGDKVIFELAEKFDGVKLDTLKVDPALIEQAKAEAGEEFMRAIAHAADQVREFHERQLRQSWFAERADGSFLGQKVAPLESAGIYVPGGRAQYPSTVIMNAIPAKVAGVKKIVMCTPAQEGGKLSPYTLAAAAVAGVDEIYMTGGAQAIAAMAYGTETIPRVLKVTGPGNAYVAAAKRVVSGDVGIDMVAGPSEVCILADSTADPELVAIDLMAQAEHDPLATSYLVTVDPALPEQVLSHIDKLLAQSTREEITRTSLDDNGLIVVCETMEQAVEAVEIIAPEHLEVVVEEGRRLLPQLNGAGAIFFGEWSSEALGDYLAGPNHTLPTGGTAAFSNPLNVDDFIKLTSIIDYSAAGMRKDAPDAAILAAAEGLWAHEQSLLMRLERAQKEAN